MNQSKVVGCWLGIVGCWLGIVGLKEFIKRQINFTT
jgi:hypothetical protein